MAILMVMLYHSIIVFPVNLHEIQWCQTLHTFLWVVQMPLFFLVSGFCYSYHGDYRSYAHKKVMRILIPHAAFSLLDILPRMIPNPLVNEQMDPKEAFLDLIFYGGSDWFLWTLFVIVMCFPLLEKLFVGNSAMKYAGILLVLFLFAAKPYVTDFLLLNMVSQYLFYFFFGYMLRKNTKFLSDKLRKKEVLLPALLGMLVFFAGFLAWQEMHEEAARYAELAGVLCSFVFFYQIACMCRDIFSRFLELCGKWSLQMYLLDAYALVATRTLLVSVLGVTAPVVIIMGNFILDTGIVLFITCFILTKARIFRIISGIPEKD